MLSATEARRRIRPGDVPFALFLMAYAAFSITLIPYDFLDLVYLFSLEQGRWVTQEWVHPIYVPLLDLYRSVLGVFGYHGRMLVPVELLNIAASITALALLYCLARRFPGASLAAAVAVAVTALCRGFSYATVRSTPYGVAFLSQTLALSLLVSERPVPPRRYALAGALAGLSMGLHAAAMALALVGVLCASFEPDPARTRRMTSARICAFGAGMLAVAIGCWTTFVVYRGIGPSYFRTLGFQSTFAGIEQVPGTSIYTSHSILVQLSSWANTMRFHVGVLFLLAVVLLPLAAVLRVRAHAPWTPAERRLAIATAANFAAIAAFFLINHTQNGFNFAAMTLVPVLLAVAIRGSLVGLAVLVVVALPATRANVIEIASSGAQSAKDPLLAEVRFLQGVLTPKDVLLTPGSPFAEMMYFSPMNIFEVSTGPPSQRGSETPMVRPGAVLRARIRWWLAQGGRVFYALGDEVTDFTGDVGGAEKRRQIFWRPETAASDRAPVLQQLRAALEGAGLELRDGLISPGGQRYAEIRPAAEPAVESTPPTERPALSYAALRALFLNGDTPSSPVRGLPAPQLVRQVQVLADLETAMPGDPWRACDVMDLVCDGRPLVGDQVVPCRRLRGCDTPAMYDPTVEMAADAAPAVAIAPPTPAVPAPPAISVLRQVGPFAVGESFAGGWSVESLSLREDGFVVVLSGEPGRAAFEVTCARSEHRSPFDLGAAHIFYSSDLEFRSFEDLGWAFQERVRGASRGTDLCHTLAEWRHSAQAG